MSWKNTAQLWLCSHHLVELCCRNAVGLALESWSRGSHVPACPVKLSVFPAVGSGMGRHSRQKININLSPVLNFFPFCDGCPPNCPSSPSSCTDRLCLSLLRVAKGQRRQSATNSLSTWQSQQIQLECNYCLHCSVCNRTSAARFSIDTSSCSPSLWQLSQLQTSIPHDIIWKKKKKGPSLL